MKSKAVIFTGVHEVRFADVELAELGPGDVLIETRYSWISNGTEGSFLRGERHDGLTPWDPGTMPPPYPMVPGYQKVGVVRDWGKDVTGLHKGQWVFATKTMTRDTHLGFGGHLAHGPTPAEQVFPLPENEDPIQYSGLVLAQVGYNSGMRAPLGEATRALVIGDGMVGQWAAQTLQQRGATVALVGRHDFRLGMFARNPNDLALNAHDAQWLEKAREWAGGEFGIVVDTVGNETNFDLNVQLLGMIAHDGHYVTAGHEGSRAFMDLKLFIQREITLHCPCGWSRPRLEQTLAWIHTGRIKTMPLITDRLPASEAAQAWERIFEHKDKTLGVILEWS